MRARIVHLLHIHPKKRDTANAAKHTGETKNHGSDFATSEGAPKSNHGKCLSSELVAPRLSHYE